LIQQFEESGQDRFRPLESTFVDFFISFLAAPSQKNAEQALSLLSQMVRLNVRVQSAKAFNTVMHLVLQSGMPNAFRHVMNISAQMDKLHVEANSLTLHNILKACAGADPEKGDSVPVFPVALQTLVRIREHGWAHEKSYLLLLQVVRKTKERNETDEVVSSLFTACCDDGWLSDAVRDEMIELMSPGTWDRLLSGRNELSEWSRNVYKKVNAA